MISKYSLLSLSDTNIKNILKDGLCSILVDNNRKMLEISSNYKDLYGFTEDELKNKDIIEIIDKDSVYMVNSIIDNLLAGNASRFEFDIYLKVKNSDKKLTRFFVVVWTDDDKDEIKGLIIFLYLVNKKMPEGKISNLNYLIEYFNSTDLVYYVTTNSGDIIFLTQSAIKMFKGTLEDLYKTNIWDLYIDKNQRKKLIELLKNSGKVDDFIVRMKAFDGEEKDISVNAVIESDDVNKDNFRILGILRDVTKKVELESRMLKYYNIIENAELSIVTTDLNGNITYVNKGFEKITGYKCGEALGENPRILKSNYHDKEFYKKLWDTISSGNIWRGQFINKKKTGELYYEDAIIMPIRDSDDNIIEYAAIKEDKSKQVILEKKLERISKLDILGNLTAKVVHDINNYLAVILMNLSYLNESGQEIQQNDLKEVVTGAKGIKKLIDNLKVFLKHETLGMKIFKINDFFENKKDFFKSSLLENITLTIVFSENNEKIFIDEESLADVFLNLISNAQHSILEKGIVGKLEISIYKVENLKDIYCIHPQCLKMKSELSNSDYGFININFSDNGKGIPNDVMDKIFEPFFTTKAQGIGTGLGLASIAEIIEKHNGIIDVNSTAEEGTIFNIYLPVTEENIDVNNNVEINDIKKADVLELGSKKIIIVEDNVDLRRAMIRKLSVIFPNIREANNGFEALTILNESNCDFDLVITDMLMPEMTGEELIQEVLKRKPEMNIIVISAYFDKEKNANLLNMENVKLFEKPFDVDELINWIKTVLSKT